MVRTAKGARLGGSHGFGSPFDGGLGVVVIRLRRLLSGFLRGLFDRLIIRCVGIGFRGWLGLRDRHLRIGIDLALLELRSEADQHQVHVAEAGIDVRHRQLQLPFVERQVARLFRELVFAFGLPIGGEQLIADQFRSCLSFAGGQLDLQMGGPGFRPFTMTEFNAAFYTPMDRPEPEFNRRTVYRINVNSGKDPLLDSFDCPDPSVKTPRRGVTTTPLQALELMNNSFVQRQANQLAERAMKTAGNDVNAAIRMCYLLALGRVPTANETDRAVMVINERGLTNVCWALLNSTEFIYVR